MIVLGISPLAHESTATLVADGRLLAAVSEERLTRRKNQGGFPYRSLELVFRMTGLRPQDVGCVAYPFFDARREFALQLKAFRDNLLFTLRGDDPIRHRLLHLLNYARITFLLNGAKVADAQLAAGLREYGLLERLRRVDHQQSHVASAVYTSGFDRCLGVSLDGYGGGASGSFYSWDGNDLREVCRIPFPHSVGAFYQRLTAALGFMPNRHEGKVLGLAAYGDPEQLYPRILRRFDLAHEDHFRFKSAHNRWYERRLVRRYPREDLAAAYQRVLEDVVVRYVRHYLRRLGHSRVALAGGVAANVKLNQGIAKLDEVEEVYVHPAMSDMGNGTGAALLVAGAKDGLRPFRLRDAFLGPKYADGEIERALGDSGLVYRRVSSPERVAARLLAEGKVVARFEGRMEYGPRALGNRSILCRATDPSVNTWLNRRLGRTEFMPFAPATLAEHAERYYCGLHKGGHAAQFMTITFDCTEAMKRESPAAVHVDGTARPQVVHREVNPKFHEVLLAYHRLTGIPTLINTSFNMHEEPIVCTPEDAVRGFLDSGLDYLAIGSFLAASSNLDGIETLARPSEEVPSA
ncbi:MAG: carbamoyltransferase [Nitrospinota bacterium]